MRARRLALSLIPLSILALAGCQQQPESAPEAPDIAELIVLTPHMEPVRDAFAQRFSLWHERMYKHPRSIRWIYKGTVEAHRHLLEVYGDTDREAVTRRQIDVFFGGGLPVHRDIVDHGYAQAIRVPEAVLSGIPTELNGQTLYDKDRMMWFGSALGGFGILYNKAAGEMRGVPAPVDWKSLAEPQYRNWVSAADPTQSGSTAECLILILLKYGWDEGWGIINGLLANCPGICPSSGFIAPNVTAGISLAGLQAEFVARRTAADAPELLEFINPPSTTAILPDPVTVLRDAPHAEAAAHFVEFVLSAEGQALWALPTDSGGPLGDPLYRYPIRPEIYQKYPDQLVVKGNPFTQKFDFKVDGAAEAAYTHLLPYILSAVAGRNHLLMQKAWATAWSEGPQSPKLAQLRTPPFPRDKAMIYAAECAKDSHEAEQLQETWTKQFREKYEAIIGGTAGAAATSTAPGR